jgi:hypothetical protein
MDLAGLDLNSDEGLGQALASLPVRAAPPGLTTSLRVISSRERQRLAGRTLSQMFARWGDRASLGVTNVMRPLALPLAGGLFSAVALFSMLLLPTLPGRSTSALDSPTMLNVGAVLVDVDDHGHMMDYTVMSGAEALQEPVLHGQLEQLLHYTKFVPATSSGRPRAGKVRIPVFTSSIVVKD